MNYTHVASLILGLALGFTGGWKTQDWRFTAQVKTIEAAHSLETAKAVEEALEGTTRLQKAKDEALRNAQIRARKEAADAATARLVADGLLSDLEAQRLQLREAARASLVEYAAAANLVFGECSRRLEEMAGKAVGHSSDVRTLMESWPRPKQ